jgi:hypothetical protein
MSDFDEARFVEEVLKPVQDGWKPTDNLFRVYLLPVGTSDVQAIEHALDLVLQQLGSQRLERGFPAAVGRLRAGHARAKEILTTPRLRQEHAAAVGQIATQLQATLRDRVAGGPGLPPQLVSAIVADSRGSHTRNEIRQALGELNASEQDPIDLPSPPSPKAWTQTRALIGQFGYSSLFDYLQATPELAAGATKEAHLATRLGEIRKRRDAATTAESSLIETLRIVIRAGTLVEVLRFELLSELQRQAAYQFPVLLTKTEAAGPRLKALGIEAPLRAVAYAVWCRQRYPEVTAGSGSGWKVEKREALAAKELRRAIAALRSGDRLTPDDQKELTNLTARVSELDAEIAKAASLESRDPEGAARIYLAVRAQLSDSAVEAGLVRCRPAPVRDATARLDESRVAIAWQPSPSTVGRLGYTVVRALNHRPIGVADGVQIVSDGPGLSVVDDDPPAAQELFYAVFAVREGVAYSEPVVSLPLIALPDVADLELIPSADAIRGRWKAPAEGAGVEVARRTAGGALTWSPISEVRREDFTDATVTPGVQYEYRLQVRYLLPSGRASTSAGRTVSCRCQEVPVAVTRLDAALEGDDVVVSWPVPPLGEVEIRELRGSRLPDGGVVPIATLERVAPGLTGIILRRRSELRARPRAGTGSLVLVAVTVLGDLAAIGPTRVIDRRIRPVGDLRATRRGREVELTWVWPDEVIEARVLHRVGAEPAGPEDPAARSHVVTRASYDSVGARFAVQPGENVFAVCTTSISDNVRTFGPLVKVAVQSVEEVAYRIAKARIFGSRRVLTVGSPQGPELPKMQLVGRTRTRPMERTQGQVLLELAGGASELSHEFVIPRELGRPLHLRLFSLEPGVILRAEQPEQLIVEL